MERFDLPPRWLLKPAAPRGRGLVANVTLPREGDALVDARLGATYLRRRAGSQGRSNSGTRASHDRRRGRPSRRPGDSASSSGSLSPTTGSPSGKPMLGSTLGAKSRSGASTPPCSPASLLSRIAFSPEAVKGWPQCLHRSRPNSLTVPQWPHRSSLVVIVRSFPTFLPAVPGAR